MTAANMFAALAPVVDVFAALGIDYQIGGSVAATTFGHARSTLDVDVVANVAAEHASAIQRGLGASYYVEPEAVVEAVKYESSFNVLSLAAYFKVDVFVVKSTAYERTAFARVVMAPLADSGSDRLFRFATAEDVILHKLDWFVKGGRVSDRQWRDILGVVAVQRSKLDLSYLRNWAPSLGVLDLLESALAAAPS